MNRTAAVGYRASRSSIRWEFGNYLPMESGTCLRRVLSSYHTQVPYRNRNRDSDMY
jgi:hypothetical protein